MRLNVCKSAKYENDDCCFFSVLGIHSNMCMTIMSHKSSTLWRLIGTVFPSLVVESKYADRMYPMGYHMGRILEETGYVHIQATKPDTIGIGL